MAPGRAAGVSRTRCVGPIQPQATCPTGVDPHFRTATISDRNAALHQARDVGLPLALAIRDFSEGRFDAAADGIGRVRDIAQRFGGSHAQRDILSLTLIEAARRAGRVSLARHVLQERLRAKPNAAWGRRIETRLSA